MTKEQASWKENQVVSLILIMAAYMAAIGAGVGIVYVTRDLHPLLSLLIADCGATIVVYIFSMILDNSSVYDPYWSVIPPFIAAGFLLYGEAPGLRHWLVLGVIALWSVRLTANWLRSWPHLGKEDWRYVEFRGKSGGLYWSVSLGGIHFFPTLIVFAGMIPVYSVMSHSGSNIGIMDWIAVAAGVAAVVIEFVADEQMRYYRSPGQVVDRGLWKFSRHPNYFGEVLFWVSLYLFSVTSAPLHLWNAAGAVAMLLMFLFVSIPWMERRQHETRGEAFTEYKKRTSPFIPWFPSS